MFLQNALHSLPNSGLIIYSFHIVMALAVLYMARNPQLITRNVLNIVSVLAVIALVYHGSALLGHVMNKNGGNGNNAGNAVVLPNGNVVVVNGNGNGANVVNSLNSNAPVNGNALVNGNAVNGVNTFHGGM